MHSSDPNIGSQTSLTSSQDDADKDVMTDYGEDASGRFAEDGSFIGEYRARAKKTPTSPTGQATFV